MTKLNKNTKRAQRFVAAYEYAIDNGARSLFDAYARPSVNKCRAWGYCQKLCEDNDGSLLTVIGAGTYTFSAGFVFRRRGKEFLCYITHEHDYEIELD